MGQSERDENMRDDPFSLTVDQYGCVWLHAKLNGIEVMIDLAEKEQAFQIMAALMAEHGFEYRAKAPSHDGQADNDDEVQR